MSDAPIEFRPGHTCRVFHTRNDELMYLHCECSDQPVHTFKYPPSPMVNVNRPTISEVNLAVAGHYAELDVA